LYGRDREVGRKGERNSDRTENWKIMGETKERDIRTNGIKEKE
jgi:hypothetical protein